MNPITILIGYVSAIMVAHSFGSLMEIAIIRGDDAFAVLMNGMVLFLIALLSDLLFSIAGWNRRPQ